MKRTALIFVPVLSLVAGGVLVAARFGPTIQPNCYLGPFAVGNLTEDQVQVQLKTWWQEKRKQEIDLHVGARDLKIPFYATGIAPDFAASVSQLPRTDMLDAAKNAVGGAPAVQRFPIRFIASTPPDPRITAFARQSDSGTAAKVFYHAGTFERVPAQGSTALNEPELVKELPDVIQSGASRLELPTTSGSTISEQDLGKIDSVVSTYTTRFPVRKKDRNNNIRLAASKINGLVLMPGEKFSFNTVVGKRTIQDGFKEAPVFVNGGHGMGVGGGICQVSSTLYNASLLADLKILQRHNHSIPVPYVPLGRDATVDYGNYDLVIRNDFTTPVALSSDYEAGRLTFRILGQEAADLKVEITSADVRTGEMTTKTVQDAKLPVGQQKVIEKGSRARSISTFRLVYRSGELIAKEALGRSYYKGAERVVAIGIAPAMALPATVAPQSPVPPVLPPNRPN